MTDKNDRLTTSAGAPVANNNHALTAGPRGPMLMQDVWFQEKLAHFDKYIRLSFKTKKRQEKNNT